MLADNIEKEGSYYADELKWLYSHSAFAALVRTATDPEVCAARQLLPVLGPLFADTTWLVETGCRWVGHLEDGFHFPPAPGALADGGSDVIKTALLFKNEKLVVSLQSFDSQALVRTRNNLAAADHVILTGRTSMSRVVNDGWLTCELVEFGALTAGIDLDVPLDIGGSRAVTLEKRSQPLVTDGRSSATRYLDSAGNPLMLSATVLVDALPFRCAVDRGTGAIRTIHATRDADNMARMAMTVLRQLGDGARDTMLEKFFGHEAHFVRWHAMREFAGMQGTQAIPVLRAALERERSAYVRRGIESLIAALEKHGLDEMREQENAGCP